MTNLLQDIIKYLIAQYSMTTVKVALNVLQHFSTSTTGLSSTTFTYSGTQHTTVYTKVSILIINIVLTYKNKKNLNKF
jgi:hypothetical protein